MTGRWGALALAVAMVVSTASPSCALPLWRGAQTRMGHDDVRKLFPGATRPDSMLKVAGPNVGDLAAPVTLAGHPAQATFYFTKNALWDIVVTVADPSLEAAKAVAGQIDEDLGQRRRCESSGEAGARRYDCAWPAVGNRSPTSTTPRRRPVRRCCPSSSGPRAWRTPSRTAPPTSTPPAQW